MSNFFQNRLKKWVDSYAGEGASTIVASGSGKGQIKRASLLLLWGIALFFVALFAWIAIAEVDNVTRAEGRVMPSAKMQVIQNLEGGIVKSVLVKPGQHVADGELLLTLSDVQLNADQNARQQQILALDARAARLLAQASGKPSQFSRQVMASAPDLMAAEQATLVSKKLEQESQISVLNSQIEQKRRELEETQVTLEGAQKSLLLGREERATIARLVERGLEPRLELVRADRALVEQESRVNVAKVSIQRVNSAINEIVSRQEALTRQFRSEALNELNRTLADLGPLKQAMPAIEDKILRADIKSPMKGIVNRVFVTTIGGIVKPGDPIMEVVPADDELVLDAMVLPKDIGFVKLGQNARVKITAYDYSIFGALDGTVTNISADAVPNEKGEAFYQVRIETQAKAIEVIDKKLLILPGMQAQVDIITGKKTILQYLSKPIVALKENAFRER
jgi:adhesin transport system membrane fusion protein